MIKPKLILSLIGIVCLIGAGIYFGGSNTERNSILTPEEITLLLNTPPPIIEDSIAIVPYEEAIDSISLEEQVNITVNNSGAGVVIITTYEQAKLSVPKSLNIKVKRLLDSNTYDDQIQYYDVNNITIKVLMGEIVNELFKMG